MGEFSRLYERQYAVALFNQVRFDIEGGGAPQPQLLHRKVTAFLPTELPRCLSSTPPSLSFGIRAFSTRLLSGDSGFNAGLFRIKAFSVVIRDACAHVVASCNSDNVFIMSLP